MKVLIGTFILEANGNIPRKTTMKDVALFTGNDCVHKMSTSVNIFQNNGIEVIPSIVADAGSNGIMETSCFLEIEHLIIEQIRLHIKEIDGIFLHLHGASEIEDLGSGEHHILFEIRKIVGPYMPIAIVCDPHGNLSKNYVEATTIIRSYRQSPHTDIQETNSLVASLLCDVLHTRRNITPVYRKLPMILGGEQSVSTDEPVKSINRRLDEIEKDERILSCSWHVGYIRHDSEIAGCGIVVIPHDDSYLAYANKVADELYEFIWSRRKEFHYTGLTMEPDEAVHWALHQSLKPVFITDSGDNVTSGAMGVNTFILHQFINIVNLHKSVLFASIHDQLTYVQLKDKEIGESVSVQLGANLDELSSPLALQVTVKQKCEQYATKIFGDFGSLGKGVIVSVNDSPIDIIIANTNQPYVERNQLIQSGIDWMEYDIVIVKCGYAFPQMHRDGICVMSLTDGATLQKTSELPFKKIMRPMYPIDDM